MRAWLKDWWPLLAGITAVMAAVAGGAWRISTSIADLETGVRAELAALETGVRAELGEFQTELGAELDDVRTELGTEIHQLRVDFEPRMSSVEAKLDILIAGLGIEVAPKAADEGW